MVRFASDHELIVEAPGGDAGATVDVTVMFEPGGELELPSAFSFRDNGRPAAGDKDELVAPGSWGVKPRAR